MASNVTICFSTSSLHEPFDTWKIGFDKVSEVATTLLPSIEPVTTAESFTTIIRHFDSNSIAIFLRIWTITTYVQSQMLLCTPRLPVLAPCVVLIYRSNPDIPVPNLSYKSSCPISQGRSAISHLHRFWDWDWILPIHLLFLVMKLLVERL